MDDNKDKRYTLYKKLLKKHFQFDNFKAKQIDIIDNLCYHKNDVLGILPTGAGKSLSFYLPAFVMNKIVIVVSPLISLMQDQKNHLDELNIPSVAYNSMHADKYNAKCEIFKGTYKIIFLTPEYIVQNEDFLKELDTKLGIGLFAIDECHCISSYGHSFRPSYSSLNCLKIMFPDVPMIATTATATITVEKDIIKQLKLKKPTVIRVSSDRPNLTYYVNKKTEPENDLKKLLNNDFTIIYCQTQKKTLKISEIINKLGIKSKPYHGGMKDKDRTASQKEFIDGKITCIVATVSFGMGIDKQNIRKVIHYGACKNIEDYVQEVGRAGRDGQPSECFLFYTDGDFVINKLLISSIPDNKYQSHQYDLFDTFIKYLKTDKCRRKILLDYFKDEENKDVEIKKCCDNCINKKNNKGKVITQVDITNDCKLLLKMVDKLPRKKGTGIFIDMLRGSKSKKITDYMQTFPGYGEGNKHSIEHWKVISDYLLLNKYLKEEAIKNWKFRYSVLDITFKGQNILDDDTEKIKINSDLLVFDKKKKKTKKKSKDSEKSNHKDEEDEEDYKDEEKPKDNSSEKKPKDNSSEKKPKNNSSEKKPKDNSSEKKHKNDSSEKKSKDKKSKDKEILDKPKLGNSNGKTLSELKTISCDMKKTLKLFNKRLTVKQIASELDSNICTIESYLCKLVEEKHDIDFTKLNLSYKTFKNIQDIINYEFNGYVDKLANLKDKCSDNMSYYEIKMTKAIIDSGQRKKFEKLMNKSSKKSHNKSSSDTSSSSESSSDDFSDSSSDDESNNPSSKLLNKKKNDKYSKKSDSSSDDFSDSSSDESSDVSSDDSLGLEFIDEYSDDEHQY